MDRRIMMAMPLLLLLLATSSDAAVIKTMEFTGGSYECESYPEEPVDWWRCLAVRYEESGMLFEAGHFELQICESAEFCGEPGIGGSTRIWEADLHDPPMRFSLTGGGTFDLLSVALSLNGDDPFLIYADSFERYVTESDYLLLFSGWNDISSFALDWPLTDDDDPHVVIESITIRTAPEPGVMLLSMVGLGAAAVRMRIVKRRRGGV